MGDINEVYQLIVLVSLGNFFLSSSHVPNDTFL